MRILTLELRKYKSVIAGAQELVMVCIDLSFRLAYKPSLSAFRFHAASFSGV